MKFCLISAGVSDRHSIHNWAAVLNGKSFDGVLFDLGEYGLDYDYFDHFDLVMVALRKELIESGIKVKQKSKAKVVVFLDGEIDHFTTHTPRYLQAKMVNLLNIVDAVAVLHDQSIPLFKSLTNRPVGVVGLPFPFESAGKLCPPVRKDKQIEIGSRIGASLLQNRNALVNLSVLAQIGMPGVIDLSDPVEMEYIQSIREYLPGLQIKFRDNKSGWDDYIARANYSLLGLQLDYSFDWGRFPLECAALRMPCVAPPSLYTQKFLFPGLCVAHHDIAGAVALVNKLVSNFWFYMETVAYARSQMEFFSPDQCKMRLFNLIS